jgi:type II secretory pathway component GspD/PulD (secretin)
VRAEAGKPGEGPGVPIANEAPPTRDAVHEIIHLLIDTVDRLSWREAGGNVGAIRELSGQLIVTQTPENQRQVARLLEQLRETRAVQLVVQAHLLTVDPKVWKKLGVEWPPDPPAGAAGAVPGGAARGSAGVFLSAEQVSQLLRAAQEQDGSHIFSAPRLMLFNGQRAYVMIGHEQPYVTGFRAVVGRDGQKTFEPEVEYAMSGMVVDITATASRDRKSATLTLRPQVGALTGMTEVPWPGRPEGSNLTVQEPQMRLTEVHTTVSIPDGGTLLLGGLEDVDGALGNIGPATRPAATQPAAPGQARMIYMLVKPTIIVQREVEQKQP